jgi:hypothetical protein
MMLGSNPGRKTSGPHLGPTHHLFQWVLGSFPRVKRPELEVDHSPLSKAEAKNEWNYTFVSSTVLMASTEITATGYFMYITSPLYVRVKYFLSIR